MPLITFEADKLAKVIKSGIYTANTKSFSNLFWFLADDDTIDG